MRIKAAKISAQQLGDGETGKPYNYIPIKEVGQWDIFKLESTKAISSSKNKRSTKMLLVYHIEI